MKRLTASLAVTALALTGCGQAGNEQRGPAAEQTAASNSQQGADE
ncbi:ABC transporter substrate-binding protein, partial [Brevibacterium paucivorans]